MRNLIVILVMLLGFGTAEAQLIKEKEPIDAKYLAGGVPVVEDKVTFTRELQNNTRLDNDSLYHLLKRWSAQIFNREQVLKRIVLNDDPKDLQVEFGAVQYIVFQNNLLVLDRSQIIYHLKLAIKGDKVEVVMTDISYFYEEERDPTKYTAEEWITDQNAIKKNGKEFIKGHGKFRMKTIDLFDDLCKRLEEHLQNTNQPQS